MYRGKNGLFNWYLRLQTKSISDTPEEMDRPGMLLLYKPTSNLFSSGWCSDQADLSVGCRH